MHSDVPRLPITDARQNNTSGYLRFGNVISQFSDYSIQTDRSGRFWAVAVQRRVGKKNTRVTVCQWYEIACTVQSPSDFVNGKPVLECQLPGLFFSGLFLSARTASAVWFHSQTSLLFTSRYRFFSCLLPSSTPSNRQTQSTLQKHGARDV